VSLNSYTVSIVSPDSSTSCRDIVDAAHLRPITKQDKSNAKTKNRLWNSAAPEQSS